MRGGARRPGLGPRGWIELDGPLSCGLTDAIALKKVTTDRLFMLVGLYLFKANTKKFNRYQRAHLEGEGANSTVSQLPWKTLR